MTLALPILAGVPGSFAHNVFHERHPKLIAQVIAAHPYPAHIQTSLHALLAESTRGVIEHLNGSPADWQHWFKWGDGLWGRPWGEAPFLWAEAYFYRKLLEAVGYFEPGIWRGIDPFAPTKNAELASTTVTNEITALTNLTHLDETATRNALLDSALWGNQADLSFRLTANEALQSNKLLVDHREWLWSTLDRSTDPTVCLIADNAGRELLPDLVLIDHLLTTGLARRVVLYVKPHPYYVSDATMADVLATFARLRQTPSEHAVQLEQRLRRAMTTDRLDVRTHDFFCAPLPFHEMPDDLAAELAAATISILKGDLNYRRLVGDRHWPSTTPFSDTVAHFPSPTLALRTLKSDVVVGLSTHQIEHLDLTDTQWRTSGEHALIQASGAQ